MSFISYAQAAEYRLGVPPFLPKGQLEKIYGPIAEYLSQQTGETIVLSIAPNYPSYWQQINKGGHFELLIGPAHLVDYEINFLDYELLAKLQGRLSFTLVSTENNQIFEPDELTGKAVAVSPKPSMGAVLLDKLFPNPVRYPAILEVRDASQAIDRIHQGRAIASFIPSPLVEKAGEVNTIYTTESFPHFGFTVIKSLTEELKGKIQHALLTAGTTDKSHKMLEAANLPGFEVASPSTYSGYHRLLESMWGYKGQ